MRRTGHPRPPLDSASLERLALRYVERYATTRARLGAYLERKIGERGWSPEQAPEVEAIAERFAERGYIDDRAFAEARARAMTRRGLGARRIGEALRHAGVEAEDRVEVGAALADQAAESALAFARRRRIGPFAAELADRDTRQRHAAALIRAGHAPALAWKIVRMGPGASVEELTADE